MSDQPTTLYGECTNADCVAGYLSDMTKCGCVPLRAVPVEPEAIARTVERIWMTTQVPIAEAVRQALLEITDE